jgi:putative addiction module killer protein
VFKLVRSSDFDAWLSALLDDRAKARILARLKSAELGNLGDCQAVGNGISEMRVQCGVGYRLFRAGRCDRLFIVDRRGKEFATARYRTGKGNS